jgi:putative FmdB family regulatory protein
MPTYEYSCGACGHQFESFHNMGAPGPSQCPACGVEGRVGRLVSASSFQLKGTGWYATDYKSKPTEPVASASSGAGGEQAKAVKEEVSAAAAPASSEAGSGG